MIWLDKLIQKTKIYQRLFREISFSRNEYEKLQFMYDEQHKHLFETKAELEVAKSDLADYIKISKKHARKILKLTKDKDIRKLCNKIIKGEK